MSTSITPFLWYDGDLAEPIEYYKTAFPDAVTPPTDVGPIFSAEIELAGQPLMMLNGGPTHFGFSEAISLFVSVDSQDEVDRLWDYFTADGGEPGRCGWLKDRYGLSWQIVPRILGQLLGSADRTRAQQAIDAMMTMNKLIVDDLQTAFDR